LATQSMGEMRLGLAEWTNSVKYLQHTWNCLLLSMRFKRLVK